MKKMGVLRLILCIAICMSLLLPTANILAQGNEEIRVNEEYHGFKCISSVPIEEHNGVLYTFSHVKTGATLAFFKNDDENKAFTVAFKTLPENDKGIPHIIEHSLLCGSEKYPLKDPFSRMISQSLNTFLNAFTTDAYTAYPIASRNDKDFKNMFNVYIDSVFKPNLIKDKKIFMQEGIRKELTKPEDPIIYNGIVYNEMKGALSDPDSFMEIAQNKVLYKDNSYRYVSGGDPVAIEDLNYEECVEFYNKYYHPSNSVFFFYGDMDISEYLEYIDTEYLSKYTRREAVVIEKQSPLGKRVEEEFFYPVKKGDTNSKTYLSLSYVVGEYGDFIEHNGVSIIALALMSDSSPLRKAFVEAGLGSDFRVSYGISNMQPKFSVILNNTTEDKKELFVKTVEKTFNEIVKNGLDKEFVNSLIDSFELAQSESKYVSNKWIGFMQILNLNWLANKPLNTGFEDADIVEPLKEKISKGYLEELMDKYFLKSNHSGLIVIKPAQGMQEEIDTRSLTKLAEYKKSLSEDNLNKLIQEIVEFKTWQATPDSEDVIKTLPALKLEDIDISRMKEAKIIEEKINDTKVLYTPNNIGNLVYSNFYFDSTRVPQDKLEYLYLLCSMLGSLDTEKYNSAELKNMITKKTGGITIDAYAIGDYKDSNKIYPKIKVSFGNLISNMSDANDLMNEIINNSKLTDVNKLKEIVSLLKESKKNENPLMILYERIRSYNSMTGVYDNINGIDFYSFLCNFEKLLQKNPELAVKELQDVYKLAFPRQNLILGVTCSEENYSVYADCIKSTVIPKLKVVDKEWNIYNISPSAKNEAFVLNLPIQYVAKGYNMNRSEGYQYNGKMIVLSNIISDYLFGTIRMQLGAYGATLQAGNDGSLVFLSWQDPNIKETYQVYDSVPLVLENLELPKESLESYIIGSIGRVDTLLNPQQEAAVAQNRYISNNDKTLSQTIDEMISTTNEDLRKFTKLFQNAAKDGNYCVFGGEQKIGDNKEFFDKIVVAFEEEEEILYGDVNGDLKVNSVDMAFMLRYVLDIIHTFPAQDGIKAADLDGDGEVNSTDLSYMRDYILEKISVFPREAA